MLRDKNLIPLSHQHQHALALCVRIERASPISEADLDAWRKEIAQLFRAEIEIHFAAEEKIVFPKANAFRELASLVEELIADHVVLRQEFRSVEEHSASASAVCALGQRLSAHIRKEERQLFERLQQLLNEQELARIGRELGEALKEAPQACVVPTPKTRLRPAK